MNSPDDQIFLDVAKELQAGTIDQALWTKAFAIENGDEKRTRAHYIRLRVTSIAESQKPNHESHRKNIKNNISPSQRRPTNRIIILIIGSLIIISLLIVVFRKTPTETKTITPTTEITKAPVKTNEQLHPADLFIAGIAIQPDPSVNRISLFGEINEEMANTFAKLMKDYDAQDKERLLFINVNSKGGNLHSAMDIGRIIRKRWNTSVVSVGPDSECYSACVFILAAGEQRVREGKIGIHRPYAEKPNKNSESTAQWFDKLTTDAKTYLKEMRVRESLFDDMISIPPEQMHIFQSDREMDRYGLLALDPVAQERITAMLMERHGLKDRVLFMQRDNDARSVCSDSFEYAGRKYSYDECYTEFVTGKLIINR
jgi:ATP-dependent protease ClpP protease subunit